GCEKPGVCARDTRSVAQPRVVVACFLSGECCLRDRNSFAARVLSRSRLTHLANRAATVRFRGIFVIRRDLLYQARALDCASARGMAGKKPRQWDFHLADEHGLKTFSEPGRLHQCVQLLPHLKTVEVCS